MFLKHKLQLCTSVVFILASITLNAQQTPQYTQYIYNTMSVNPGYTGSLDTFDAVLSYRDQWQGIDGAPVTQYLGVHGPLRNEKIGIGLNLVNDRLGPSKQFFADGNASYSLQMNASTILKLGLKAGFRLFSVDFTQGEFQDPNDSSNNNVDNSASFSFGAGAYLYSKKWYLGFSIPDFLPNQFYDDTNDTNRVRDEKLQAFLIGGYVFDLTPELKFKPAFLAKYISTTPLVVDVSANFLLYERFTLGVSYRIEDSFSGLFGIEVFKGFFAGYSYDASVTELANYNSGTHEITLRYTAPPKTEVIGSPRFF